MSPLKDNINPRMVRELAVELVGAWPDFPADEFAMAASDGLETLELMGRIRHVADALATALPDEDVAVVAALDGALASSSFEGWMVWPCAELLGHLAPRAPEVYLPLMARLTHRSSCEFAIRPCIEQHPQLTFRLLHEWVDHPDEHVRRLVSEGTRPRLPWAGRLHDLQRDPRPGIALLDRLRDDPAAYVRRSVANHLGDIVKDHPDLAVATATRWHAEGGRHVVEVIRHGLRTLIKAGDATALALVGYDARTPLRLEQLEIRPQDLAIGGVATLTVAVASQAQHPVPVVLEYVVHYRGARGPRKPKAYRLGERVLEPGVVSVLRRRHTFRHASIRTLYPGEHRVELQVNGRVLGSCRFELTD